MAAALEALIADRSIIEDGVDRARRPYWLFTKIWNSVSVNGTRGPARCRRPASRNSPISPGPVRPSSLWP